MYRDEFAKLFWNNVKIYKDKKKTTWRLIGIHSGLSYNNLMSYICKKRIPSVYKVLQMADYLGCTVEDLCR